MASFHPYNLRLRGGKPARTVPENEENSILTGQGQTKNSDACRELSYSQAVSRPISPRWNPASQDDTSGASPVDCVRVKVDNLNNENIFLSAVNARDSVKTVPACVEVPDSDDDAVVTKGDDDECRPWIRVSYKQRPRSRSADSLRHAASLRQAPRSSSPSYDKKNLGLTMAQKPFADLPPCSVLDPTTRAVSSSAPLRDDSLREVERMGKPVNPDDQGAANLSTDEMNQNLQDELCSAMHKVASARRLATEGPVTQQAILQFWDRQKPACAGASAPAAASAMMAGPPDAPAATMRPLGTFARPSMGDRFGHMIQFGNFADDKGSTREAQLLSEISMLRNELEQLKVSRSDMRPAQPG